jgi:hypothetical protein
MLNKRGFVPKSTTSVYEEFGQKTTIFPGVYGNYKRTFNTNDPTLDILLRRLKSSGSKATLRY